MTAAGTVTGRHEAVIRLRVRGPTGRVAVVQAVVDTGFNGWLTLPAPVVADLRLTRRASGSARMGDGSPRQFDVYTAEVDDDGQWRAVSAAAIGRDPLAGMRLFAGHRLTADVTPGGAVRVAPLST